MESRDYQVTIKANISAEEAFRKINQVSLWWTKGIRGKANQLGDRFTMLSVNTASAKGPLDFSGETFVDLEKTTRFGLPLKSLRAS